MVTRNQSGLEEVIALLRQEVGVALRTLQTVIANKNRPWSLKTWLTLAEGADSQAHASNDWRWRLVAIKSYDVLTKGDPMTAAAISAMLQRLAIVRELGAEHGEARAHIAEILAWLGDVLAREDPTAFLHKVVAGARALFAGGTCPNEEQALNLVRRYNRIREMLRIARSAEELGFSLPSAATAWIEALPMDMSVHELVDSRP